MRKQSTETKAVFQILIAGILWGLVGPLVKLMELSGSTVEVTSFLRMGFAFLIMGGITVAKFGWKSLLVSKRILILCIALGVISNGIYNVVYSLAIANAGIAVSAVLLNTAPIFTILLAVILFKEGINVLKIVALVVNVVGCSLAATGGQFDLATISVFGILCGIAAGFTYGVAAIITRLTGVGTNTYVISTYSYLFATITIILFFQPWSYAESFTAPVIGYGFILALIPTSLAYLLYYQGILNMKETSKVPIIASVEMVATAIISVVFFNEYLSLVATLGIVLVIVSIALMNVKRKRPVQKQISNSQ